MQAGFFYSEVLRKHSNFVTYIDRPNECGLYVNEREENGSHMEAIFVAQTSANRLP